MIVQQEVMVESKEKCKREEKTLSATIEKGMPDGEDIVFKYESEQKPGQVHTSPAPPCISPAPPLHLPCTSPASPHQVMMCHFMGLPAFAPDALLRFQLRTALKVRGDIGEIQGRYRGDIGEI